MDAAEEEDDDDVAPRTLPDPGLFGIDPDPRNWALADDHAELRAAAVARLDPRVRRIRATAETFASTDASRYVDLAVHIELLGDDATVVSAFSLEPFAENATELDPDLLRAVADDLQSSSPVCAEDLAPPQGPQARNNPLPGGVGWWARQLCPQQSTTFNIMAGLAVSVAREWVKDMKRHLPACAKLPEPALVATCEAQLGAAIGTMTTSAIPQVALAIQYVTLRRLLAEQAMFLANNAQLGNAVPPAVWLNPILAANGLAGESIANAATRAGNRAVYYTGLAVAELYMPQLADLAVWGEVFVLPQMGAMNTSLASLMRCMTNVANWIVIAGAAGLVVGLMVFAREHQEIDSLAGGADEVAFPPSFIAIDGPWRPRANEVAALSPLAFDIDELPSYQHALSAQEVTGKTYRKLDFGYEEILDPLAEDVWGIDPTTELPTILAPAGTPISLDPNYGAAHDIGTVGVSDGHVSLSGAFLDLSGQSLDENGQPLGLVWDCVSLYDACSLTIETTGSPTEIAEGARSSASWRIITTSSIVDPETGEPIENHAGYVVRLDAALERPASACYDTFDPVERRWLWNALLPGCGPHGIDPP